MDYMKLNELSNLQLPHSKKKSPSKSSKKKSTSENSCIKIDTSNPDYQKQSDLTLAFVPNSTKQSPT